MKPPRKVVVDIVRSQVQKKPLETPLWKREVHLSEHTELPPQHSRVSLQLHPKAGNRLQACERLAPGLWAGRSAGASQAAVSQARPGLQEKQPLLGFRCLSSSYDLNYCD